MTNFEEIVVFAIFNKSYLNNLKDSSNSDNRSSSLPPNERDSIYGFRTAPQRPSLAKKEEDDEPWVLIVII